MSTNQVYDHTAPTRLALSHTAVISEAVRAAANRLGVGPYLADTVTLTEEVFGSFLNVEVVPDPEVPDWEHIVFEAPVRGSVEDALEKSSRWLRQLRSTSPDAARVFSFVMEFQE
jgi:hypothetical protein